MQAGSAWNESDREPTVSMEVQAAVDDAEEAEDERVDPEAKPLIESADGAEDELRRIRIDTYVGMGYSHLIAFFILVTTASTLHVHGITDIATSAEAAEALRPIAGPFASAVFALGIVGTGMLAIPVLAGSAAYAVGEARQWPTGLGYKPREAKAFYGTIAVATLKDWPLACLNRLSCSMKGSRKKWALPLVLPNRPA